MSSKNSKKKGRGARIALIVFVVALSLILLLLLGVLFWVDSLLGQLTKPEDQHATLSSAELDSILNDVDETLADPTVVILEPEEIIMPTEPVQIAVEDDDNLINIMLVGQDTSDMTTRSRSDSMILITINKERKTLTMTSFLRDMYVTIPEYYDQRLNVAYAVGGFEALYDSLEYNFGVKVNKGISVNFSSFRKVVDAVGGVDITLTGAEAGHLNEKGGWGLRKGENHLNGSAALAYARIRKLDGDFARTNRQRTVMTAILEKAKTLSVSELYELVKILIPMVATDMTEAEILTTAVELAPLLKDLTIITQRIPIDDAYYHAGVKGMAVLIPDLEVNRQFLEDTIGNLEGTG